MPTKFLASFLLLVASAAGQSTVELAEGLPIRRLAEH
jgi:hypothetical protein